jgi:FHA domain-containing protein/uncharacterized protein DUF4388
MQVILQGSFRNFPADQLLNLLAACRQTGTLEVSSIKEKMRLFFTDGSLIHAEGPETASVEDTIYALFIFPGDTFTFSDQTELPKGVQPGAIDLKAVAAEGARRAAEWQRLIQIYPSEDIKVRVEEDPKTGAGISLKPEEFKVLMKIGKGRTLAEIRADLNLPQVELYPILHRLETNGLLQRVPAPGSGAPNEDVPRVGTLTSSTGKMFPLVDDLYAIGRDEKNEIVIDDGTVSTVHARIAHTTQGFTIEDVQSRNGTFINGEKIDAPRLLADGDTLRFGKVVFTFNVASQTRPPTDTNPG